MKKIIYTLSLSIISLLGTTQTLCDYAYMSWTPSGLPNTIPVNMVVPTTGNHHPGSAPFRWQPLYIITFAGNHILGMDSVFWNPADHVISNTIGADTITTCIDYIVMDGFFPIDTLNCCFTQAWDGTSWVRVDDSGNPDIKDSLMDDPLINNPFVSIEETTRTNKKVVGVYNMLGQPVNNSAIKNEILITVYSDGSISKVFNR